LRIADPRLHSFPRSEFVKFWIASQGRRVFRCRGEAIFLFAGDTAIASIGIRRVPIGRRVLPVREFTRSCFPSFPTYRPPTFNVPLARSVAQRRRFCASTYQIATVRTFGKPRTGNCCRPRCRANAFTHSAVEARSL